MRPFSGGKAGVQESEGSGVFREGWRRRARAPRQCLMCRTWGGRRWLFVYVLGDIDITRSTDEGVSWCSRSTTGALSFLLYTHILSLT